jgi:hypothetical protein
VILDDINYGIAADRQGTAAGTQLPWMPYFSLHGHEGVEVEAHDGPACAALYGFVGSVACMKPYRYGRPT